MIISTVEIEDFDRFWSTFSTKGAPKRKQHGSRGARVFRSTEDPNRLHTLFDWDREGFEAFMADPEVPEIMKSAGLKAPPVPTYIEPAGELDS